MSSFEPYDPYGADEGAGRSCLIVLVLIICLIIMALKLLGYSIDHQDWMAGVAALGLIACVIMILK